MSQDLFNQTRPQGIRWGWIVAGLFVVAAVSFLLLKESESSVQYYMTASEFQTSETKYLGKSLKLAGKVKKESLKKENDRYEFVVEEGGAEIPVVYSGLAPDTFKEGADVVVDGKRTTETSPFEAKTLMAKCASKYEAGGLPPLEQYKNRSKL